MVNAKKLFTQWHLVLVARGAEKHPMSLSDRVIVMKDGEIKQIGTPQEIYEDPVSKFVAGFVGKVAFFPVELTGAATGGGWNCRMGSKVFSVGRAAPGLAPGHGAVVMARPESLRLVERGSGYVDGTVRMSVYLGHSVETFVDTPYGEVLVQVDDPASKRLIPEGNAVSIGFEPERIRLIAEE